MCNNGQDFKTSCRNCKQTITMSQRSGKWAPYDAQGIEFHDCPAREKPTAPTLESFKRPIAPPPRPAAYQPPEARYPQHRVKLVAAASLTDLEEFINDELGKNDELGYNHRGVTILLDDLDIHTYSYLACIHYEILQPRETRK